MPVDEKAVCIHVLTTTPITAIGRSAKRETHKIVTTLMPRQQLVSTKGIG